MTGVPAALQVGRPDEGGFGALPMERHVKARWARWAVRLASSGAVAEEDTPWWVRVARALLARSTAWPRHPLRPYMLWLECGKPPPPAGQPDMWLLGGNSRPLAPSPLARLVEGLRALPRAEVVGEVPDPGPWCAAMPLWGNALLDRRARLPPGSGGSFTVAFHRVAVLTDGAIATVADALRWTQLIASHEHSVLGLSDWSELVRRSFHRRFMPGALDRGAAREELELGLPPLLAALPAGWEAAARAAVASAAPILSLQAQAQTIIAGAMGWYTRSVVALPAAAGAPPAPAVAAGVGVGTATAAVAAAVAPPVGVLALEDNLDSTLPAPKLTVKAATSLQLHPVRRRRARLHALFVEEALAGSTGALPRAHDAFSAWQRRLRQAWRLRWENSRKEVLWRLSLDAVRHPNNAAMRGVPEALDPQPGAPPPAPAAAGPSGGAAQPAAAARQYACVCGGGGCCRAHHFDTCPVARAVYACLQAALPPGAPEVQRWHVWLAEPPAGAGVHRAVWLVVCLAALAAMEAGRRRLWRELKRREEAAGDGLRQTRIPEHFAPAAGGPVQPPPPPPPSPLELASARAVAEFWAGLQSFVSLGVPEDTARAWGAAGVGASHPFFGVVGDPPALRLSAMGPPAAAAGGPGSGADSDSASDVGSAAASGV